MPTRRAVANGNWSNTTTWNGGVLPGNGDTVYASGFTVAIDQNVEIGGANNPSVAQGSLVAGQWYQIATQGTTNWTSIGASSSSVGTIFLKNATAATGSGGVATALATITTAADTNAGAAAGGGFTMTTAYTLAADIRAGTTTCLTLSGAGNTTINSLLVTGAAANAHGIINNSTGTIIFNSTTIQPGNSGAWGILNNSSGNISISSSFIYGGNQGGILNNYSGTISVNISTLAGGGNNSAISNASVSGVVNIASSAIIGGSGSGYGVANASSGVVNVSNSAITASTTAALFSTTSGSIICTNCTFTASTTASAISSTNASATNRFSGTFIHSVNGYPAINATRWILNTAPTNSYFQVPLDGINANSFVRFYTADNALGQANPTDVRAGVSYASGNLTGRLTVPARGSVAFSVNYGPSMPFTATCSGATATATLAYSYPLVVGDQITVTGASNSEWNSTYTIASVVSGTSVTFTVPASHSATAGTGANMQTTGTAVLDPAAVASAVWGAASRTITGGLVDTATTLTNAPASVTASDIWSYATRTTTGGTVDTLTNAPTVPSASAIASQVRTELSVELSRVDQNISSRLAASAYTAPTTPPTAAQVRAEMDANSTKLAAIKSKTDLLNTDRLAQCATTSIVGNLIAQSNS